MRCHWATHALPPSGLRARPLGVSVTQTLTSGVSWAKALHPSDA